MTDSIRQSQKRIVDLELLNRLNEEGCPACGQKFTLGDTVVSACGAWEGGSKLIHENEAVWDSQSSAYIERRCYAAGKGSTA